MHTFSQWFFLKNLVTSIKTSLFLLNVAYDVEQVTSNDFGQNLFYFLQYKLGIVHYLILTFSMNNSYVCYFMQYKLCIIHFTFCNPIFQARDVRNGVLRNESEPNLLGYPWLCFFFFFFFLEYFLWMWKTGWENIEGTL